MTFAVVNDYESTRWRRAKRSALIDSAKPQRNEGLKYLAFSVIALLLATSCSRSVARKEEPLPVFDGVTTDFTLTRSRIKPAEPLEVRAVFRNTTSETRVFGFLDFGVDARLYSKGQLLGDLCPTTDNPLQLVTLKPGESYEIAQEVFTPRCYNLAPGQYSIRFNYNLRALRSDALREQYEEMYNHPQYSIVPWDGRDHPFTVVK
jgi:hypothetical protein